MPFFAAKLAAILTYLTSWLTITLLLLLWLLSLVLLLRLLTLLLVRCSLMRCVVLLGLVLLSLLGLLLIALASHLTFTLSLRLIFHNQLVIGVTSRHHAEGSSCRVILIQKMLKVLCGFRFKLKFEFFNLLFASAHTLTTVVFKHRCFEDICW